MIVVVMIVSMAARDVTQGPAGQDRGVAEEMRGHARSLPLPIVGTVRAAGAALAVVADDGEEDVLEGRLLLDVFDLGGRVQLS